MIEMATGVVVSAFVNARQLQPFINLDVVNLNSLGSLVDFFARSRHDDVPVHNGAARVPVTSKVHPLSIQELQVVSAWIVFVHQLTALEHAVRQSFVVATANHEYTWLVNAHLDHLEIVRKVPFEVNELVNAIFVFHIVNWDGPRVLLEHVQLRWEFHWQISDHRALRYLCICSKAELLLLREPSVPVISWLSETLVLFARILSRPTFFLYFFDSFTILDVLKKLTIGMTLLAAWTFEFEKIHEIFELHIDLDRPVCLMTHRTFQLTISTAACTKEHLTVIIWALLWIPYQVAAQLA